MNTAAAAGKALSARTVLRPSLSDSDPSENDPSIFAKLNRPINQPVSCKVIALAVRSRVGVHAAELQNTEPPINSANARIRMGVVRASLKEPLRLAVRIEEILRIQYSCSSMSAVAMAATSAEAA